MGPKHLVGLCLPTGRILEIIQGDLCFLPSVTKRTIELCFKNMHKLKELRLVGNSQLCPFLHKFVLCHAQVGNLESLYVNFDETKDMTWVKLLSRAALYSPRLKCICWYLTKSLRNTSKRFDDMVLYHVARTAAVPSIEELSYSKSIAFSWKQTFVLCRELLSKKHRVFDKLELFKKEITQSFSALKHFAGVLAKCSHGPRSIDWGTHVTEEVAYAKQQLPELRLT